MIDFILLGFIGFFVLWLFFINVMTWKKHREHIPKVLQYPLYVIALVGYVVDVVFNLVYGSIIFMEWPKQWTLSKRLRELLIRMPKSSYKWKVAYFMCTKMIEPWDWNHCGLEDLK